MKLRPLPLLALAAMLACDSATPAVGPGADVTGPEISLLTVMPDLARVGSQIDISFHVGEPTERASVAIGDLEGTCDRERDRWIACRLTIDARLGEGPRQVTVQAWDKAGNRSEAEGRVVLDFTAPTVAITAPPPLAHGPRIEAAFAVDDPEASIDCLLDSQPLVPCASPALLPPLEDGEHVLEVRATDLAGNLGSAEVRFTSDRSVPRTTIAAPVDDGRADRMIEFTCDDPAAGFECALDTGAWAPCTSPLLLEALDEGAHLVAIRATDPAGNVEEPPASVAFTVDTTAPETTLVGPSGPWQQTSARFEFTSSEPDSTFVCSLDGAAFAACTSPVDVAFPDDGPRRFEVAARDRYGNQDPTPAGRDLVVDAFPINASIVSSPPTPTNLRTATIAFTSNKPNAIFRCALDGEAASPCGTPTGYSALAEGEHRFSVVAVDAQGRTSAPAEARWTVDLTPPKTRVTAGPAALGAQSRVRFEFTADEPAESFACALGAASFTACVSPLELDAAEGAHRFQVRATDLAGNVGAPAVWSFEVDLTAPDAPRIDQPDPSVIENATPTLTWSAVASAVSYSFELALTPDFGQIVQSRPDLATTYVVVSPLDSGRYYFRVRARDAAGNESPPSRSGVVEVNGWRFLNPRPQGATLLALACIDERTCWFVGEAGVALRTVDGGATLRQASSGTTGNLTGIHVFDATTGVAVGQSGTIVRTDDGGVTWFTVPSGVGADLYDVRFRGQVGYAVGDGGLVLKSVDAGLTWTRQPTLSTASLRGLAILDPAAEVVVVVGGTGKMLRTEDGGASWSTPVDHAGTSTLLRAVSFADANTGYAVGATVAGASTLRKTTDGGRTWGSALTDNTQQLYGVLALSPEVGLTVGDSTQAIASIRSLAAQNINPAPGPSLRAVTAVPGRPVAWAVGDGGVILKATDLDRATGVASFAPIAALAGVPTATASQELRAAQFLSPTVGYVFGGSGQALKTVDGGATFTPLSPSVITATKHLWAASFVDPAWGWVGGDGNFLARTEDGTNFTTFSAGSISVRAIHFKSRTLGIIAGTQGKILRWSPLTSTLVPEPAFDVAGGAALTTSWRAARLVDAANGWIVGDGGKVVRYDAANARWLAESSGTTEDLHDVWAFDAQNALAVGNNGRLLRRGPTGWRVQSSGTTATLKSIAFTDALHGWIAGDGTLLVTEDGGLSWAKQRCPTGSTLQSISAPGGDTAYVVGSSRNILKSVRGGR